MILKPKIGYLLIGFVLISSFTDCSHNEEILTTGVEGIMYRGPINLVEIDGEPNNAPFSAVFHVYNLRNSMVTSFTSNESGFYKVMLSPGNYFVVPDASAPLMQGEFQKKEITVQPLGISTIDLYFDTGIR